MMTADGVGAPQCFLSCHHQANVFVYSVKYFNICWMDIHGFQIMYPNDIGDLLILPIVQRMTFVILSEISIRSIRWFPMEFGENTPAPLQINCNNFCVPLTLNCPIFWLMTKYLQN